MCTVTIVPMDLRNGKRGFRLACNRDELACRPAAMPPREERFSDRLVVMPVDPVSGGTWIAANDGGLVMTLLNVTPSDRTRHPGLTGPPVSRGLIIPSLIDCASPSQAEQRALLELDPARFAPFRLIITDGRQLSELVSDGLNLGARRGPLGSRPRLFTSSGLGDLLVRGPRTRLFEAFFHSPGNPRATQDAFHRHSWPQRPHLSVCMRRPDARTVSHTIIESSGEKLDITYLPHPPDMVSAGDGQSSHIKLGPGTRPTTGRIRAAC